MDGNHSLSEEADYHLLPGETIQSILPLSNQKYLFTVLSGSVQMIDLETKNNSLIAYKFKGRYTQCMVPFPGFDE